MINVVCTCPWCQKETIVECDEENYNKYIFGDALIQEAFPDMDIHARETLVSGMCNECQEKFFVEDEDEEESSEYCSGNCSECLNFIQCTCL